MLKHCVFLNFKSNVTKSKQFELFKSLSSLKNKIDGIVDFDYGNNLDFEMAVSQSRVFQRTALILFSTVVVVMNKHLLLILIHLMPSQT